MEFSVEYSITKIFDSYSPTPNKRTQTRNKSSEEGQNLCGYFPLNHLYFSSTICEKTQTSILTSGDSKLQALNILLAPFGQESNSWWQFTITSACMMTFYAHVWWRSTPTHADSHLKMYKTLTAVDIPSLWLNHCMPTFTSVILIHNDKHEVRVTTERIYHLTGFEKVQQHG